MTCECSFVPTENSWQPEFFQKIGLGEFVENNFKQLGAQGGIVLMEGLPVGKGVSKKAAEELGLLEGTPVSSGVINV